MKDQQWRRDPQSYGFFQELHARYADIDTQRHVNNVAVFGMHAEACMRFQLHLLGEAAWQSAEHILHPVHAETNFLQVTHYQGPVQCGVRLIDVDEHECTLATGLFQSGSCVGIHQQRLALWCAGRQQPIPDAVRMAMLAHKIVQETPVSSSIASRSGIAPEIDAYRIVSKLSPRVTDFDADGCTSTLALMRYAAQARGLGLTPVFKHAAFNLASGSLGMRVGRISIDILARRRVKGEMRLAVGVTHLGNSSITLRTGLFDQRGCAAVSDNVLVFISRHDGRPAPMPQDLRDDLIEHGVGNAAGSDLDQQLIQA